MPLDDVRNENVAGEFVLLLLLLVDVEFDDVVELVLLFDEAPFDGYMMLVGVDDDDAPFVAVVVAVAVAELFDCG